MRFTRRHLLQRGVSATAALGVAPALLAACGGSSTPNNKINFFSWQGYDLLDIPTMKAWRTKNHVAIHSTYISSGNDVTAKFTTGGGKGIYNLSTYVAGFGPFYVDLGIPSPIDLARVPNFAEAYPLFRSGSVASAWWHFKGQQWALPFTWGLQGINYDASKISAPTSYLDLLSPKLKGKIGVTDDAAPAIIIGAHVVGIFRADSLYTHSQLSKIIAFWQRMKANARLIVPSYGNMGDLLAAGEIVAAAPGWAAVNTFAAAKGDHTVQHVLPKEGSANFCDAYMIPSGSSGLDPVYEFINLAFSPQAQAQEAANLAQAAVVPAAVDLMDSATRTLYPYRDIQKVLTQSAPIVALPVKAPAGYATFSDWNAAWQAFKA